LKATQDALQAHPDIEGVVSVYSAMSQGAATAIKQAGRGNIAIIDGSSGDRASLEMIKDGSITAAVANLAGPMASGAIQVVHEAFSGKQVPRAVSADGNGPQPQNAAGIYLEINKDNVADFEKYSY
jgi:ribose transport system substrate-binding protein